MLTSPLYISQVKKVRACQPTEGLSSRTLIALTSGLLLWVVYGVAEVDWIIIAANLAETSLTGFALYDKLCGIARAAKSRRIALKPLSESVKSTRAGRYFCNSVLIPAGRFRT
jgi:MtN3 and saliva related transmembrane protein